MTGTFTGQDFDAVTIASIKASIRDGILAVHPEGGGFQRDIEFDTINGKMRAKTHDASPDCVTTFYLNGWRLYKLYIECTQSRDRLEMCKMVETKLNRESFISQCRKVMARPLTK